MIFQLFRYSYINNINILMFTYSVMFVIITGAHISSGLPINGTYSNTTFNNSKPCVGKNCTVLTLGGCSGTQFGCCNNTMNPCMDTNCTNCHTVFNYTPVSIS